MKGTDLDLTDEQRRYVLNGATGDDELRDEDLVRLDRARQWDMRLWWARSQYGGFAPAYMPRERTVWIALGLIGLLLILVIILGGVK